MSPKVQTDAITELQEQLNRLAEYVGMPEQQLKGEISGQTLEEKSDFDKELEKAKVEMLSIAVVDGAKLLKSIPDFNENENEKDESSNII